MKLRLKILGPHPLRAILFNLAAYQLEKSFGIVAFEIREGVVTNAMFSKDEATMSQFITQYHYNENVVRD